MRNIKITAIFDQEKKKEEYIFETNIDILEISWRLLRSELKDTLFKIVPFAADRYIVEYDHD